MYHCLRCCAKTGYNQINLTRCYSLITARMLSELVMPSTVELYMSHNHVSYIICITDQAYVPTLIIT